MSIKPVGGKVQLEIDRLDEGLDTTAGPSQVDIHGSPDCLNVVFDSYGSVATRDGSSLFNTQAIGSAPIDGLATYNSSMIAWAGGDMYRASNTTWVTIPSMQSQFASGANIAWTVYQQVLFYSDGTNGPYRYELDSNAYRMGIAIPSAPTATSANLVTLATGGPQPGDYHYRVSYLNTHLVEGQPGSASVTCTLTNTTVVSVTCLPTAPPTSHGINQKFVYRCGPNSGPAGTYRFVGSVAIGTNSFLDTVGTATFNVAALAVDDGTAPTPFTTIKEHKDRLFFDDSTDRTIARYTNYTNPYISEALNFRPLNRGDGAEITAIGVQDDFVSFFKKNAIWVLAMDDPSTDANWLWAKTPGNLGITGPKAFVEVQNAIMFLGQRNRRLSGFHILTGLSIVDTQDARLRSDNISNRIEADVLNFNRSFWHDVALGIYNNSIFCAVAKSGDTKNQHIYWLDMTRITDSGEIGSWSLWDGRACQVKQFITHTDGNLYAGSANDDGFVLRLEIPDQYNDAGAAINSYWWSKPLGGEEAIESYVKDFRYLGIWYFLLGAWNMRVNYRVDEDTTDGSSFDIDLTNPTSLYGTGLFGSSTYGGLAGNKETQHSFGSLLGRKIQVRFGNNSVVNTAFKVHSFKLLMNLRRILKIGGSTFSSAETARYQYGFPGADRIPQPNVAAQWLFEETSGSIVDIVNGITLTQQGSPLYGTTAGGLFADLSPGITFDGLTVGNSFFQNALPVSELDIGTEDFVFEWLSTEVDPNQAGSDRFIFTTFGNSDGVDIYWSGNDLVIALNADGGATFLQMNTTLAGLLNDGQIHKYRVVGVRSGNLTLYVDGVQQNTASLAAFVSSPMPAGCCVIGQTDPLSTGSAYKGTIYEFRVTIGNSTNNSGGPGGG